MSQAEVLKLLEDGKWYTVKEIAHKLGKSETSVRRNIKNLEKWGDIEVKWDADKVIKKLIRKTTK